MTGAANFVNSGYGFATCTVCGCFVDPDFQEEHRAKCWPP